MHKHKYPYMRTNTTYAYAYTVLHQRGACACVGRRSKSARVTAWRSTPSASALTYHRTTSRYEYTFFCIRVRHICIPMRAYWASCDARLKFSPPTSLHNASHRSSHSQAPCDAHFRMDVLAQFRKLARAYNSSAIFHAFVQLPTSLI